MTNATTLDDIATAITDLGTMMSDKLDATKDELRAEMSANNLQLRTEMRADFQRLAHKVSRHTGIPFQELL